MVWGGQCLGAKRLVSWERLCVPKHKGRLRIRDLQLQNTCLLMKRIHALYTKSWYGISSKMEGFNIAGSSSCIENQSLTKLTDCRRLTKVTVGDRKTHLLLARRLVWHSSANSDLPSSIISLCQNLMLGPASQNE